MNTRKLIACVLGFGSFAITGCVFPTRSVMPATIIECSAVDAATSSPIVGAALIMVYEGPNGESVTEGPFLTDVSGRGRIELKERAIWMNGTDAYFAGGYIRHIEVHAVGYEESGFWENFDRGLLEKKAPFTFRLVRIANRFGAVKVMAHEDDGSTQKLSLEVIDGPNAGEHVVVPIMPLKVGVRLTGKTLYFRQSLGTIRSEAAKYRTLAENFSLILREGAANEPYVPDNNSIR